MILVAGVNGTGKTTTVGKLAWHLSRELDRKVVLAAGDTFRAAGRRAARAVGAARRRAGSSRAPADADPGSVAYDGVSDRASASRPTC